jgi:uncharacterized membrane protein YesL
MANIFGGYKYKEGKGVEKDAPPLPPVKQFFAIIARKFWYFVRMNMLYAIVNIISFTVAYFVISYILTVVNQNLQASDPMRTILDNPVWMISISASLSTLFVCIPVVAFGPFQAGMTYLIRGFVREEPLFMWSDFIDTTKKNFTQGLAVGAINLVLFVFIILDLYYYSVIQTDSLLKAGIFGFIFFVLLIFMMMQMYLYPMLITFKLSIWKLYKNAFLFAMLKFVPNLGLLLISFALIFAIFFLSSSFIFGMVVYIIFLPAFIGFMNTFFAYRAIKKYMIDPVNPQ